MKATGGLCVGWQSYQLTPGQVAAVQKLADAYVSGQPDVAESDVVNHIAEPLRRGKTLEQNFRSSTGGLVPAWNTLVVPGQAAGTFRLAPIPQAILTVDLQTPGMRIAISFPKDAETSAAARSCSPTRASIN